MAQKRKRPTREELDERIRIVLDKIPASIDREPSPAPVAVRAGVQSGRIVSGTVEGPGARHA